MDVTAIEKELIKIVQIKNTLNRLGYDDEAYDEMEDELHHREDHFIEAHGKDLEAVLQKIHQQYCPDTELLSPISYIAHEYRQVGENDLGPTFDVGHDQGVFVEVDRFKNKPTKLVILPNPLRIVLNIDPHAREEVWSVNAWILGSR